ncbi:MAG: 4Fe-4S dicluster domain-containing protein [Planctomycetota bacterium]|nr:4Fe-4S dicluster domain-containing protein [Planctomycetota bacterium]
MSTEAQAVCSVAQSDDFVREVATASGANLAICLQCRKCSCGCPVAARSDLKPHEIVRLVQLGERDGVLASRMIWECTSCETCATRCPQNVDIPAMMDALRQASRAAKKTAATTTVPVFNDIFLRTVRRLGRMYEAGLMASYKLRTFRFFEDMDKVPLMLRKRKIALLPHKVRGGAERKRLFDRAKDMEGKSR